jgi:tetratricopeptide (TPR) repeat protein
VQSTTLLIVQAAKLLAVALILAEGLAHIGAGLVPFLRAGKSAALELFGCGYLLGLCVIAATLFGLGATGLFSPPAMILAGVALLFASDFRRKPRIILAGAARELLLLGPTGLSALVLGAAPALLWMMLPENEVDSFIYHLGIADQWLKSHKLLLSWVPAPFHLPTPIEMTMAIPIMLGDDRIGKTMTGLSFVATGLLFASECIRRGRRCPAWLGPLVVLASANVLWLVPITKNDISASAMVVAGALLVRRGLFLPGAVLLGSGCAAKMVYGPFIAVWCLAYRPPMVRIIPFLAVLVIPSLPWFVREYVASGNPFFLLGGALIPTFDWSEVNWASFDTYRRPFRDADSPGMAGFLAGWWSYYRLENLLLCLALPGLVAFGRFRREVLACLLGHALILAAGHHYRFLLPATWLLCLMAAAELERIPSTVLRRSVCALVAVYALTCVYMGAATRRPLLRMALLPASAARSQILTTYGKAIRDLSILNPPRLLLVGEQRCYLLPGRIVYNGCLGETPVVWKLARESRTAGELRKKFRQMGVRLVLYNCAGSKWVQKYSVSFEWTRRMAGLYSEFCRRYLDPAVMPERCDYANGGYYLYRVSDAGRPRPLDEVFFLPGAEGICYRGLGLMGAGRYVEAIPWLAEVVRDHPAVMAFRSELAFCHYMAGNFADAYRLFGPPIAKGYIDTVNVPSCAIAAYNLGRLDEAERLYRTTLARYPDHADPARVGIGSVFEARALLYMGEGRKDAAEAAIARAEEWLRLPTAYINPTVEIQRRQRLAQLAGFKGDIQRSLGHWPAAIAWYTEALRIAPDAPGTDNWRKAIGDLAVGAPGR